MTRAVPFELTIQPVGQREYAVSVVQLRNLTNGREPKPPRHVAKLGGVALQVCTDQVLEELRRAGHRSTDLQVGRKSPLPLPEEAGVRLGLLFLALKPLTKVTRMEQIAAGIRRMPDEEAYYWFSKCSAASNRDARRAQHAIRALLAPG